MSTRAARAATVVACALIAAGALGAAASPAAAAAGDAGDVPASFRFAGGGWGHGVGLSQYGARGMAAEGYTAEQIITHYFTGTKADGYRDDRDIRVSIGRSLKTAQLRAYSLGQGGGRLEVSVGTAPARGFGRAAAIRLKPAGAKVKAIVIRKGTATKLGAAKNVTVRWAGTRTPGATGDGPTYLKLARNGTAYRGDAKYRWGSIDAGVVQGRLEVVNSLRIHDEYLRGISEIPSSWPAAALQAQAIAARSYAVSHTAVRQACRCQSDDGTGGYYDQTFVGYARETQPLGNRWAAAVDATAVGEDQGKTITYQGKPIAAFYFSSSGGRTQNSEDVWGAALPYARSVDDHWSIDPKYGNPNASWSVNPSQRTVAALFGLPDVSSIAIASRDDSGAVKKAVATSSDGETATLGGVAFCTGIGAKSLWVRQA